MILTLLLAQASQTQQVWADPSYLQPARYLVVSGSEDRAAPGGFAVAGQKPFFLPGKEATDGHKVTIGFLQDALGLHLLIMNGTPDPIWFNAADSNLLGYLQAKNTSGAWKPIEYHLWSTCGNSFHRVQLPAKHAWSLDIPLAGGRVRTAVRWHYKSSKTELNSQELNLYLPANRFTLDPKLAETMEVVDKGDYPILKPKSR